MQIHCTLRRAWNGPLTWKPLLACRSFLALRQRSKYHDRKASDSVLLGTLWICSNLVRFDMPSVLQQHLLFKRRNKNQLATPQFWEGHACAHCCPLCCYTSTCWHDRSVPRGPHLVFSGTGLPHASDPACRKPLAFACPKACPTSPETDMGQNMSKQILQDSDVRGCNEGPHGWNTWSKQRTPANGI